MKGYWLLKAAGHTKLTSCSVWSDYSWTCLLNLLPLADERSLHHFPCDTLRELLWNRVLGHEVLQLFLREIEEKYHVSVCFLNKHVTTIFWCQVKAVSPSTESPCYCLSTNLEHFKGIVHQIWNIMSWFTRQHVIQISLTLLLQWNIKRENLKNVEAAIFQ